jgi:hypothetical protein
MWRMGLADGIAFSTERPSNKNQTLASPHS